MSNSVVPVTNTPRVAICQPYFILGGRLSLVLEIVKSLNSLGIEPDILALGYSFTPDQIKEKYGQDLRMKFRTVAKWSPWRRLPQDYQILVFNWLLNRYGKGYNLLINSSNSQVYLPEKPQVLSYIHFPREYRIKKGGTESNFKGRKKITVSLTKLSDWVLKKIYIRSKIQSGHIIVCNSRYSRDCFKSVFPEYKPEIPVIYPPINLVEYQGTPHQERHGVVSLGRFTRLKMQLDQIKVAEQLPGIDFHIVGFVTEQGYFDRCQEYVRSHQLTHVHLHPNLNYDEMIALLNSSRYFLHSLINEPYGITAVEAIAAGCIPLVHNSGGQKETVPIDELRYDTFEDIPHILMNLEKKSPKEEHDIIFALQSHARNYFDEPIFIERMSALLTSILNS